MTNHDWTGKVPNDGESFNVPMMANLYLDNESRIWRVELQGTAAMLLFFMLDSTESGLIQKLWEEAKFDRLVKYDLGELNED